MRRTTARPSRTTVIIAWAVTACASAVPAIVWTQLTGGSPAWLPWAQIALALFVVAAGVRLPAAVPLRRFAASMAALTAVAQAEPLLATALRPLASAVGPTPFMTRMLAEQGAKLIGAAAMIVVLRVLRLRRQQFFLTLGDLDAPIRPVRLIGFFRPDPWWKFGLVWGIGIAGVLFAVQWALVRPSADQLASVLTMVPAIIFVSSLNAFSEEMTYRAPMIATLQGPIGNTAALWQSAFFFGVAHYFGIPGGLFGALVSIFMGWILGKAMIETRGLFWPWLIHALSDIAILTFLAIALR